MHFQIFRPQDHNITSEWLLNAVRSQLHFSQISAWNEKLKLDNQTTTKLDIPPSDRPRKLSRENCNFKKYESNCDEEELLTETKLPTNKPRKLNIVYNLKIPRESYEVTEFQYKSTKHYFPITDIGNNVYLRVCLQSLPRVEDIPTLMCMCIGSSNPGTLKRRRSKDLVNALTEEVLALNMVVGTSVDKCKGQVFPSDSIGVINPDKGCSSSFSLSTFANPSSRGTTPEQSFPCSENKPCKRKSNTDSLYKYIISGESIIPPENNVIKANFVLVDDRMQTPCREKGKHRCIFDEENDQGQKSEPKVEEKKVILDEKRAKEIAKYMRRLRKESKLKQLKESSSSSGDNSECYNDKLVKNKTCDSSITKCTTSSEPLKSSSSGNEGYTCKCCGQAHKTYKTNKYDIPTSIPILQASRFDYVNRFSSFRTSVSGLRTSHNLYTVRDSGTSCDQMAYVRIRSPESCQDGSCTRCCDRTSSSDENYRPSAKKLISSCTQTEDLFCDCGKVVTLEAKPSKMKRSEANHDLAKSESLRQEEDDDDDDEKNDDEEVIYNKCDNSVVITRHCDITDNANCQDKMEGLHSSGVDDTCVGIIRKPRLKRLAPMVDKIDKIIMERNQSKNYKNEDRENSPLPDQMCTPKRKNTKIVDVNQSVLYEKGDYKVMESADNDAEKKQQMTHDSSNIPSVSDMDRFRYRLDSAASMVFHSRTGLPLTSSPAPLRRGKSSFDFDSSINSVSGIKRCV